MQIEPLRIAATGTDDLVAVSLLLHSPVYQHDDAISHCTVENRCGDKKGGASCREVAETGELLRFRSRSRSDYDRRRTLTVKLLQTWVRTSPDKRETDLGWRRRLPGHTALQLRRRAARLSSLAVATRLPDPLHLGAQELVSRGKHHDHSHR